MLWREGVEMASMSEVSPEFSGVVYLESVSIRLIIVSDKFPF